MKAKAKWLLGMGGMMAGVFLGLKLWTADVRVVKVQGIEGVIVKARTAEKWGLQNLTRAETFWTPGAKDIEALEGRLHAALEAGVKAPASITSKPSSDFSREHRVKTIGRVLDYYSTYQRQYVGLVINGKRYVYLNSFPVGEPKDARKAYVFVHDGGEAYWRVLYSIEDGGFSQFSANGGA